MAAIDEVHALAEAILEAASVARLGLTVSYDDGVVARHIYVNEAAAEILGYRAEELVGSATAVAFAPEEKERLDELSERWRRGDALPALVETVGLRKDGERIPVEVAFSVVPLAGEPAIVAFLRDIRQRKAAEEALRRSESRFRQLIEAAPDAIGVMRDGRFVYVNPSYVRLLGRPLDELVDRAVTDFVHPDDRHLLECLREGLAEPNPARAPVEYRVLHPDGQVTAVELSSILIEYEGRPAVLGFARDTTERKQIQARLAFADRMATLGMLAAGVAHEINNPLAYAVLNIDGLDRELKRLDVNLSPTVVSAFAATREGLARVATIVRDLLSFSTPASEERWPVDAETVLESAVNVAMHMIRGRARVVRKYALVPALMTDPARLGQILLNLLFNATQSFAMDDEVANELSVEIASPDSEHVTVTIADNGPGIPRRDLDRIFEPFFTTKPAGTGLGLAICQTLVTSLRGRLEVESVVGKGARFTVWLPTRPPSP